MIKYVIVSTQYHYLPLPLRASEGTMLELASISIGTGSLPHPMNTFLWRRVSLQIQYKSIADSELRSKRQYNYSPYTILGNCLFEYQHFLKHLEQNVISSSFCMHPKSPKKCHKKIENRLTNKHFMAKNNPD